MFAKQEITVAFMDEHSYNNVQFYSFNDTWSVDIFTALSRDYYIGCGMKEVKNLYGLRKEISLKWSHTLEFILDVVRWR